MIQSVLDSANDAIDKEHLAAAVADLSQRVDDWKSLKVEGFGDLLRFGTFTVIKGDSNKDTEREVRVDLAVQTGLPLTDHASITSTYSSGFFSAARTSTPTSKSPS